MSMNFLLFQVIAFSDEEGVRFHSTFLGSAALAGVLPVTTLQISDKRFPWITLSLYLLMILFIISLFMHNPFLVADIARCSEGKLLRNYRGKPVTAQVWPRVCLGLRWGITVYTSYLVNKDVLNFLFIFSNKLSYFSF